MLTPDLETIFFGGKKEKKKSTGRFGDVFLFMNYQPEKKNVCLLVVVQKSKTFALDQGRKKESKRKRNIIIQRRGWKNDERKKFLVVIIVVVQKE